MNLLQPKKIYSRDYLAAFHAYAKRSQMDSLMAALYEGEDSTGSGVAIPTIVDGQIVALAQDPAPSDGWRPSFRPPTTSGSIS